MKKITTGSGSRFAFIVAFLFFASGPLVGLEKNALFYNKEGQKKYDSSDYRSAIHFYRLALERNPDFRAALMGLARSNFALGQYPEARDHYEKLLALDANNREASIGLGRTLAYLGDFTRAEQVLGKVAAQDPGNVDNNFARGEMNHLRGQARLAGSYYNQVIRRNPAHFESLLGLGVLYGESGNFAQADAYLERARRINPVSYRYHLARGEIALLRARRTEDEDRRLEYIEVAHSALSTALQLSPQNARIENRLVFLDLYRGNLADSLNRARELDAREPDDPALNYLIGSLMRLQKRDVQEYMPFLERALERDPNNSLIRFGVEEALIDNSMRFSPQSAQRRKFALYEYERARYHEARNRRDLSDLFLDRTLTLYPGHTAALNHKLEDFRRLGDFEMFLNTLVSLRNANPGEERLQFRLEQTLLQKNKWLPYREGLFAVPPAGSGRATYERTPTMVFVFDFAPEDPFLQYPDAPVLFARALRFHLNRRGRLAAFPEDKRARVMETIRRLGGEAATAPGVYYRPEYIAQVEEVEGQNQRAGYVLNGRFRVLEDGLRVSIDLIEKSSSRRLDQFSYSAQGRDALHEISHRVAGRLREKLPFAGRVVKVKPGEIFVNLGQVDGVKKDDTLKISRNGRNLGAIKIVEISSYVSRGVPTGSDWNRMNPGDHAMP